jgi:predicted phosphodiesterase
MPSQGLNIAVISDIHGFSLALDRVLEDIARHNVDHIVVAGDLVEGGPDPVGVLDRVFGLNCAVIQGNTDYDIAKRHRDSRSAAWTAEGREWLLNLPFDHRITPPGADTPWQDLLVVHANPTDFSRPMEPDASPEDLELLIGKTKAAVIAFGHIHIAYTRQLEHMKLIDVSAVGNPKDGDLRSKWGLISWDTEARSWSPELHFVDYPLVETEAQLRASGIPKAEKKIRRLREASYE